MKNCKDILKHLNIPNKNKLEEHRCINLIIHFILKRYEKYIIKSSMQKNTLVIVTSHQGINQEIIYKLENIRYFLKELQEKFEKCVNLKIENIRVRTEYVRKNQTPKKENILFYVKNVKDFKNMAQNENIHKKFEEIKEILRKK